MTKVMETGITQSVKDIEVSKYAQDILKLEEMKRQVTEKLDALKRELLVTMQAKDVLTLKTETYTISRATRKTIKVEDEKALAEDLTSRDIEVSWVEKLSDQTINTAKVLAKSGTCPSGVQITDTPYVSIRVTKKEKK